MKNRVLNTIIVILVLFILFIGIRVSLAYHIEEVNGYNSDIESFIVKVIKGEKSLNDIETLDVSEGIKEDLTKYYQANFYNEEDLVLIFENISLLDNLYEEINNIIIESIENGVFNRNKYMESVESKYFSNYMEPTGKDYIEDFTISEEEREKQQKLYYAETFEYNTVDTANLVVKDNNLYMKVKDLSFNQGLMIVSYKGFKIEVIRDILDKSIRAEIANQEKYQSIELKNSFKEDDFIVCIVMDFLKNHYDFKYSTKWGRIDKIYF